MSRYAISDLHGRYDLLEKIKAFLKPEDTVYVLGDCGDRGPDSWKVIEEVRYNPQFVYLKGNHEDMLVNAMRGDFLLSFMNGGKTTLDQWKIITFSDPEWAHYLDNLPVQIDFTNDNGQQIILTHAGFTPRDNSKLKEDDLLWDRYHFDEAWDEAYNNTFIIHGHTPICYLNHYMWDAPDEEFRGAFWYCADENGKYHKCDLDCGAVVTGCAVMLNLDTFEEHLFYVDTD